MKVKHKMQTEAKVGVKRKLEKTDPIAIKTKVPLKADLVIKLNDLQNKFDSLEATNQNLEAINRQNLDKIKGLEEKIKKLEKDQQVMPKFTKSECGFELNCAECNFEATDQVELREHMEKIHGWLNGHNQSGDDLDISEGARDCRRCDYLAEDKYDLDGHIWMEHEEDEDGQILCKFCCEKFANIANLMKHKKIKHREKVSICKNYNDIGCPFEDQKCWFLHLRYEEEFRCNICDTSFQSKSDFMKHRKTKHKEMVQMCKNKERFVFKNSCWFIHEALDTQKINENNENKENNDKKREVEKASKKRE